MTLGSIVVRLTANTGSFETDLGRAAQAAKKRAGEIDASFRKAGIAIGTALGVATVVMAKFVRNTIEAEQVQAQLASRIKDTYGAAGRSIEQLGDQADKLQSVTVFDDEAIGKAQAMLLTFKEIGGVQFDRTIESALDLSTVMGTDLADSAKLLGKALSDPEKGMSALSRAGVVFTEAERDVIKAMADAGDKAGAQDRILDKLQGTMGTAAEAARNTLGGALAGLSNAFDNLLEGDTGSDGVRGSVEAINNLAGVMNDPATKQGMDTIASGLANIAAQAVQGISALARFQQSLATISGIQDKRAAGAPASAYSDKELQATIALLGRGKRKAIDSGDTATAERLQKEITALIRENTQRIQTGLATQGVDKAFDFLAAGLPKPDAGGGGGGKPKKTGSGPSKPKAAELTDEQKAAKALNEEYMRTAEGLRERLGLMGLETEAAKMKWETEEGSFKALDPLRKAELIAQAGLVDAKQKAMDLAEDERRAAEEAQKSYQAAIADIQMERDTLGMTNEQLEIYNRLKWAGVDANSAFGRSIVEQAQDLQKARKAMDLQVEAMDAVRDTGANFIEDMANGVKPIDAFKDALDGLAQQLRQMIAENLMEKFFGQKGSASTGSAGGGVWDWLGGLFGSWLGGGASGGGATASASSIGSSWGGGYGGVGTWATGGYTGPGGMNEVAGTVHRGEVVWSKGDIARAGGVGAVEGMRRGRGGRGDMTINQTINVPANTSYDTAQQAGQAAYAGAGRAARRNG